ncbi:MAG: hypothetical protein U0441_31670 [Polyangiaceae bacterium]
MKLTTMFGALTMMAVTSAIFVAPGCTVTMDDAAKSYASALCASISKCLPGQAAGLGGQATCESIYSPEMERVFALPDIDFGADQVQRCADILKSIGCDELYSYVGTNPDCQFVGTRAEKEPCAAAVQCASGYCRYTSADGCGVCAPRVALGADCSADWLACEPGTFCGSDGKCATIPVKEGDACMSGPCGLTLMCVDGKCAASEGAACTGLLDCNLTNGYVCDDATMTCKQATFADVGEACGDDQLHSCTIAGNCEGKKCVARSEVGEDCNGNVLCARDLECVDNKCAERTYPTCD